MYRRIRYLASLLIILLSTASTQASTVPRIERGPHLEPLATDNEHLLPKRTYQMTGGRFPRQQQVLNDAFPAAIALARLASDSPAIPEPLRQNIALKYFRPEEYSTAKQAFRNIVAGRNDGDPRLSSLHVDLDDSGGDCTKGSLRGNELTVHAVVIWEGPVQTMVVCPGFWTGIDRVQVPDCGNVGTFVSHKMRFPAGTVLHEFL